jgi:hypothetical protein
MIEEIPFKNCMEIRKEPTDIVFKRAAIRLENRVFTGWRHAAIMAYMRENGINVYVNQDMQGFVDQDGCFYRRACCSYIAYRSGQTKELQHTLLSEHLWDYDGNPI